MSPLEMYVRRNRLELKVRVSFRHLALRILRTNLIGESGVVLFHRFRGDSDVDSHEARYLVRCLREVIDRGGSAQLTLGGEACQLFRMENRDCQTPIVLEVGALRSVKIPMRISEAERLLAFFRDYFDELA